MTLTDVQLDGKKTAKPLGVRKTAAARGGDAYMVTDVVFQLKYVVFRLKYEESPLKMTMTGSATGTVDANSSDDAPRTWSQKGLTGTVTD